MIQVKYEHFLKGNPVNFKHQSLLKGEVLLHMWKKVNYNLLWLKKELWEIWWITSSNVNWPDLPIYQISVADPHVCLSVAAQGYISHY